MANCLSITSFNSRKSHLAITSLFSSTLSDIFIITEPATHPQPTKFSGYSSISATISFPHDLLYIRSSLLPHVTVISSSDNLIHITLKLLHTAVHIFGIYGPAQQLPQVFTHLPSPLPPHSLLIGDFNARHPSWDPTHPEAAINHNGRFLRNQLDSQFLSIENDIFKPTHYPDQAQYHPTIIDLIISTLSMSNYITSTDTHSPHTPSDHAAITTTISPTLPIFDPPSRLIWAHIILTSPDPEQASVEKDLINSHILKKLVESPPSDIGLFSEQLSQEFSKIQNIHSYCNSKA
jgi:hypothetical protein